MGRSSINKSLNIPDRFDTKSSPAKVGRTRSPKEESRGPDISGGGSDSRSGNPYGADKSVMETYADGSYNPDLGEDPPDSEKKHHDVREEDVNPGKIKEHHDFQEEDIHPALREKPKARYPEHGMKEIRKNRGAKDPVGSDPVVPERTGKQKEKTETEVTTTNDKGKEKNTNGKPKAKKKSPSTKTDKSESTGSWWDWLPFTGGEDGGESSSKVLPIALAGLALYLVSEYL